MDNAINLELFFAVGNWTNSKRCFICITLSYCSLLSNTCTWFQDIDIDVVAVLNDTVGTLMACAFKENSCEIGVIVGTGTNACYMEKISRCYKLADEHLENDSYPDEVSQEQY